MPHQFESLLYYVKQLNFTQKPNYHYLRTLINEIVSDY